jgi:hypothetical protein
MSRHDANQLLRDWLHQWFEPTVLPRKWRHLAAVPLNTQGKRDRQAMEALFLAKEAAGAWRLAADPAARAPGNTPGAPGDASAAVPRLEPEVLRVERDGDRLVMELRYPADSLWFQGHFPQFRLLPGVVQIDWLMSAATNHLGIDRPMRQIPRLKFMKPILPDETVVLELEWHPAKSQLDFKYTGKATGAPHSSGRIKLEPAP